MKPENLLIDNRKRIKICDFGWSAEIQTSNSVTRNTFCGTIDYMAPEIMLGKNQGKSVDIWCLGVLLFELLHDRTPYHGLSMKEKLEKMKKGIPLSYDSK